MKRIQSILACFMLALSLSSCSEIEILSPPGPAGLSAYQVWLKAIADGTIAWTSDTDVPNFFKYLKGEPGASAYAVWQDWVRSGTVDNPHEPGSKWDPRRDAQADFYYFLTGARGDSARTPFINDAGNWQIGDRDTGVPAKGMAGPSGSTGPTGSAGKDGSKVTIGQNENWEIDGVDTGIPTKAKDGRDGKSAYQLWEEEVLAGTVKDKSGQIWPTAHISLTYFWDYLSGQNAIELAATNLIFKSSAIDPLNRAIEQFTFQTEPAAKVVMTAGNLLISELADANGICVIGFPNSQYADIPVLVTAIVDKKQRSSGMLLSVKVRPALFKLGNVATWYNAAGNPLTTPNGVYQPNENPPFISVYGIMNNNSVRIPFEAADIQEVMVLGGVTNNFILTVDWEDSSKTKGYIQVSKPKSMWTAARHVIILQLLSEGKAISLLKIKVETFL